MMTLSVRHCHENKDAQGGASEFCIRVRNDNNTTQAPPPGPLILLKKLKTLGVDCCYLLRDYNRLCPNWAFSVNQNSLVCFFQHELKQVPTYLPINE